MTLDELKEQKIWFLWNYAPGKNGKKTKVPMPANGGMTGTSDNFRNTWTDYDSAITAQEKHSAAGIGFKIPDNMYFLDIDGRPLDDSFVQLLLERHDTYAETSPSGNVIHILGICDNDRLPLIKDETKGRITVAREFYQKNPNNHIELYFGHATNRYATFTGNAINAKELTDGTTACLTTLDKDMRRKSKTNYSMIRDGDREAFDIICNLRKQKNGEKFSKLYDHGDWQGCGYGSQSEADAGLCSMLAFRTGPDPEAIDRLFRESALYRSKWDRDDYRESTISYAIECCKGDFHRTVMDHPPFIRFDDNGQAHVIVPLLAKYCREHMKYVLVRDNGRQALHRYIYEGGCYRFYADNMMMGMIKQFIADYDEELVSMWKVSETLQHISTDLNYIGQDELNADEAIINFENTLLKVSGTALKEIPHTPDIYSTIQIPCEWKNEEIATPVFDSYLNTLTDGDKALQQLLLEFIGACLSNIKGWRMKKALFLVGDGDTGKSQLKSLVEMLLGKGNFIGIDLKEIEARFGTGAVYGTRLAGSSDMSFLSVDELKTFKKMTGGDSIYAEFKGQQGFEYTYNGLLWFCMNRLPKFGGDTGKWVYDRIMVVECRNVIPKDKQDKQLLDKMYAERVGIVHKAIKALQTVVVNGYRFSEPESVIKARESYQCTNSTVITFFEECMCPWEDGRINYHCTTGRVFKVYQARCRENNNGYARNYKDFREQLVEHLGSTFSDITTRRKGNTYFKDYTLTSETKELFIKDMDMMETNFYKVATPVAGPLHYCYPNRASPYSGYGYYLADVAVETVHTPRKIKVCKDR